MYLGRNTCTSHKGGDGCSAIANRDFFSNTERCYSFCHWGWTKKEKPTWLIYLLSQPFQHYSEILEVCRIFVICGAFKRSFNFSWKTLVLWFLFVPLWDKINNNFFLKKSKSQYIAMTFVWWKDIEAVNK